MTTTTLPDDVLAALAPAMDAIAEQARTATRAVRRHAVARAGIAVARHNSWSDYGRGALRIVSAAFPETPITDSESVGTMYRDDEIVTSVETVAPPVVLVPAPVVTVTADRECSCTECETEDCDGDCDSCEDSDCPQCHDHDDCATSAECSTCNDTASCCGYCDSCGDCHGPSQEDPNTRYVRESGSCDCRYCTQCDHFCSM